MPDLMDQLYELPDVLGHIPGPIADYLEWVAMQPIHSPARVELARLCSEVGA